jgi:ATP-dependent DNA ligase
MTKYNTIVINNVTYDLIRSSVVIEAEGSKAKKYWQGHIVRNGDKYYTASSSWRETKDGVSKKVWSEPYYAVPTNVGQSNHRGNIEQAEFEYASMYQKQTDKRNSVKPLPMLAHTFRHKLDPKKSKEKHIVYPCYVQPKFDGFRMVYDGTEAWTRGNKPVLPEVYAHLHFDTQGYTVDGELILPGNLKVNETAKAAKKFYPGVSDTLQYILYDIVEPNLTYDERLRIVQGIVWHAKNKNGETNVVLAETHTATSTTEIEKYHAVFVAKGYEGTIIRNVDGKYTINKRSNDLQKHKDFIDGEYEIINVIPSGGGSAAEVGKFVCITEDGDEFESTATGSWEDRHEYLVNKKNYIGKFAKVKFREFSGKNNVPFHSNVLEIRDTKEGGY